MSQVRFIGCLHLGHEWMAKHRGFKDSEEHDDHLIKEWNKIVRKKDLTYILGDISMETNRFYHKLDQLNGKKIVVLGNHDEPRDVRMLLLHVETVAGMIDYKGYVLTHCPIHPAEISFCRGNIHAHIHENKLQEIEYLSRYGDPGEKIEKTLHKYHCVDVGVIDYKPKLLSEFINGN